MTINDLQTLYDYSYWANKRLFGAMSRLTEEEFTRSVAGSYGSIRNTLVHIMSAEAGWLDRCGGPPRGPRLMAENFPTVDSVVKKWEAIEAQTRTFLASLTEDDVARIMEFSFTPGVTHAMPIGEQLQHAANHAVHHRGQVALLLRALGHAPGDVDILYYFTERRSGAPGSF